MNGGRRWRSPRAVAHPARLTLGVLLLGGNGAATLSLLHFMVVVAQAPAVARDDNGSRDRLPVDFGETNNYEAIPPDNSPLCSHFRLVAGTVEYLARFVRGSDARIWQEYRVAA